MKLNINNEDFEFYGDQKTSLLIFLRDQLSMTGTKGVCSEGFCGSCTVHIDGKPALSCLTPVGVLAEKKIRTIEGVGSLDNLNIVQKVFKAYDVVQCGMCFPGIVMTFTSFLEENANPTRQELKKAMVGNLCRCTGYERIIDALMSIKEKME